MVFTLHRYIFRELFKVFVLAAVALTLMMSLGGVLRPVQEYGVGPRQVLHLIGYFLPITLTFVLPMAALFAAALVYGRFASDNELDACKASGVSLCTLVYPGLALAIIVAIANLLLSFHVVPAFVHLAKKSYMADAKQILFRNIQRRGYYKPPDGRYLIYADQANSQNDTLSGVIVVEVKSSRIKKITTAERAEVNFNPHEGFNEVRITAYNTYQMDPEGDVISFEWLLLTKEFGSLLGDDIKFKKIDEMKKIRVDPMRFSPIAKLARRTYAQFTTELLAQDIVDKIANDNSDETVKLSDGETVNRPTVQPSSRFYKLHSGQKLVEFTAGSCTAQDEKKVELSGEVVVVESDAASKQPLRTLRASKALLHLEGDELAPTLTMVLYNATWQHIDGSEGLTRRYIIRGLILPKTVTDKFVTEDVLKAISPASTVSALQ
ncbi:MAG: LptF/LptG family permease, partial [Sedimentisphaerales bacterium]